MTKALEEVAAILNVAERSDPKNMVSMLLGALILVAIRRDISKELLLDMVDENYDRIHSETDKIT